MLSRWGYTRGRQVDARLLDEFGDPGTARVTTVGTAWLTAVSALIVLLGVASLAAVAWVWVATDWPPGVRLLATALLVGVAAALAPRFLSVPTGSRLPANQGKALRALVEEVAHAVGADPPSAIVLDMSLNAAVARFGWRQRTVLVIGVPLWVMLPPEARVSVLAHEFGHVVNADPMRSVLTLPARSFGHRAVVATGGRNPWRRAFEGADSAAWSGDGFVGIIVHGLLAAVNTVGATIQLLVDSVAMPDSRRAELLADLKAREVGGTAAFLESSERLLVARSVWQDLWDQAPRTGPEDIASLVERSAARRADEVPLLRQETRRRTDLWSSHPCEDDRMTLVERLPDVTASVVVDESRWSIIDAEMSAWYAHIHQHLLGTRDRVGAPKSAT